MLIHLKLWPKGAAGFVLVSSQVQVFWSKLKQIHLILPQQTSVFGLNLPTYAVDTCKSVCSDTAAPVWTYT